MGRTQFHPNRSSFLDLQVANGDGYFSLYHSQQLPAISPLRLEPRDDTPRVQLQRQRWREQHATAVVSKTIPGLKTSAGRYSSTKDDVTRLFLRPNILRGTAFFASLRTNLRLYASPPPSPISTPPSMRASTASLPPPSPLSQAVDSVMGDMDDEDTAPVEDPLVGIPELKTYTAKSEEDKIAALKLTADSIAQMRQTANNALITHPLNMAIAVAILALVARFTYESRQDIYLAGTSGAGIVMTMLAAFRFMTKEYLFAAEAINWDWLGDANVIVTKFGEEVIGTVIVEWISGEGRTKRKKAWRGEIRAYTVRLKYRNKGVGSALLEEAVKEARKKGAETIEFADDHASKSDCCCFGWNLNPTLTLFREDSQRVLPSLYNASFDKREQRSRELLQDLLEASPGKSKRK